MRPPGRSSPCPCRKAEITWPGHVQNELRERARPWGKEWSSRPTMWHCARCSHAGSADGFKCRVNKGLKRVTEARGGEGRGGEGRRGEARGDNAGFMCRCRRRGESGQSVLVGVDHCFDSSDHDRLVHPRRDRHVTPAQRCPSRAAACFCCRCLGHACEPAKREGIHHSHGTLGHYYSGLRGHSVQPTDEDDIL
jgi:hypothetical protein